MLSTDLSFGRQEYLMSGGKVTSTSPSISATHSIEFNGTPYSCRSMPRIHNTALVISVLTPIRRPFRSAGVLMPLLL